jgi:hypothetical protein
VLYRKAYGHAAKLCFGGHVLMESRHGLCADLMIHVRPRGRSPPWLCARCGLPGAARGRADKERRHRQGVSPERLRDRRAGCHMWRVKIAWKCLGLDGRTTTRAGCRLQPEDPESGGGNLRLDQDSGGLREQAGAEGESGRRRGAVLWLALTISADDTAGAGERVATDLQ